ncbi:MAG: phosphate butyryltransferase [Halanaerobiales bacterium]|nr:phosphate butyryltransferase [Halanaerobiales bacterium]
MIKDFDELLARAGRRETKRLVVAAAGDEMVLKAVKHAQERKLIKPVLVGDRDQIDKNADRVGLDLSRIEVINLPSGPEACERAVQLVSSGEGDILMKGMVETPIIMKAILNKEYGLRTGRLISHIAMIESRTLGRLLFVTDGGMNIKPDLMQKKEIIENAIEIAHELGYERPRVAILAAIEKVNPDMLETVEAAILAKMGDRGQIRGGIIDGPLAIDNAISEEAARIKGINSLVAGRADILLVPEIVAGNILGKSPVYFAGDRIATVIGGTSHPVVLTSRASTAEIKLISIAATVLMADNQNS